MLPSIPILASVLRSTISSLSSFFMSSLEICLQMTSFCSLRSAFDKNVYCTLEGPSIFFFEVNGEEVINLTSHPLLRQIFSYLIFPIKSICTFSLKFHIPLRTFRMGLGNFCERQLSSSDMWISKQNIVKVMKLNKKIHTKFLFQENDYAQSPLQTPLQ